MEFGFEDETILSMSQESRSYVYALLYDYEDFIKKYGVISVNEFLKTWTCLSNQQMKNLQIGDHIFDCIGREYEVKDIPALADDGETVYVEVSYVPTLSGSSYSQTDFLNSGEAYSSNIINAKMYYMKIKPKGENKLCPILITNQVQVQN